MEPYFLIYTELTMQDACSMPIVMNADCDGKLPIATLPIMTV
jgi:hypothetical protein